MTRLNHLAPPHKHAHCCLGPVETSTSVHLCLGQSAAAAFYLGPPHWWQSWTWHFHQTDTHTNTGERREAQSVSRHHKSYHNMTCIQHWIHVLHSIVDSIVSSKLRFWTQWLLFWLHYSLQIANPEPKRWNKNIVQHFNLEFSHLY